jgi:hypothetical protein
LLTPSGIAVLPRKIKRGQRLTKVLQIAHVIGQLIGTAAHFGAAGIALHPSHRLGLGIAQREQSREKEGTTENRRT